MMINSDSFEFGEILSATLQLQRDLRLAVEHSDDPKVSALSSEVNEVRVTGESSDAPPLTIAFVGQYNAGKSTILRVLTGREDILIDSDVCTDTVTAYDWNGVQLLDTPGVHAGYPDHDEKTYARIDRADLLVFVVTNELFDDTIGHHFRDLAFNRQHAGRMLLVVNKMGQDPGSPETKGPDIEKVTAPLTLGDFRCVFIDARSWLEAKDADDEDRSDLLEIANIDALTKALNFFITERGLTGRLSAPLFMMRGVAEQATHLLSTDDPGERAVLELLHRKRSILLASSSRLRTTLSGVIGRAVNDIGKYGDEVAEAIEPGKSANEVEALHTNAQSLASARSESLSNEVSQCVEAELAELKLQLDGLRDSVLVRELTKLDNGGSPSDIAMDDFTTPAWQVGSKQGEGEDWTTKSEKVGNVAKGIGNLAARWATGPSGEGASAFSVIAARGSDAHKAVYNVGKFFGVKFQPWGAVKVARAIGNAGRVISAVGGVLVVVAQISEDREQEQHRIELRDTRDSIRSYYRESALSVQEVFWEKFESFYDDFYESELLAIGEIVDNLIGNQRDRKLGADSFSTMAKRAEQLIDQIRTKSLRSQP